MTIRKATLNDSEQLATFLLLAMEDIVYKFIGEKDPAEASNFLQYFTAKEHNQYSYQNCFVTEIGNKIVAAANVYNGADLHHLRAPIVEYIRSNYDQHFIPEDETTAGEFYLDCISVDPDYYGKGIGTAMLQFIIQEFVINKQGKLGLLVDENNSLAKKIYLRLGFVYKETRTLFGRNMEHLQKSINNNI